MFEWNPDWASAIASIESAGSGNYGAVGPLTSKGNRAYGRYQVMDFNIPSWTRKYVGREMTPEEFLADPKAQDLVFQGEFGSYVQKYGNPQDAASIWFTGRPASQGAGASDILGTTGADYVSKFNRALGNQNVIASGIGNDALVALGRAPTTRTEAPMGLLNMGQPEGQQAPAQAQGNGFWDNFAGGILADPDRRSRLAMAFEGMALNPNQSVIALAQSNITDRKTQATLNKTIEWLRGQPNGEAYIRMIEAGASPAQVIQALMQAQAGANGEIKEVGGKLVRIMPDGTVQEVYGGGPDQEAIAAARKEFTSLQPVKDFSDVSFAYSRVIRSAEDPSPAGDLALIFNYMKILDPGSVVREGEFATAQNAGGVDTRVRSMYNSVINGERLTPEQRADFADRATRLYSGAQEQYGSLASQYSEFARQAGLPVEQVIPNFGYSGDLYAKPLVYQRPPTPAGVDDATWSATWQAMTDQERAAYLKEMQ